MKDVRAVASAPIHVARRPGLVADYLALAKPRLNFLVVLTSGAGYYLGANGRPHLWGMAEAALGTALVAGGAAALNQLYERDTDALMRRTRQRPLPDGRIDPVEAQLFGAALAISGLVLLALRTTALAALLALATLVIYLVVYTPMKRRSAAATLVGAIPGALPALIGWTGSSGSLSLAAIFPFAIVFLWQIPHFMAIAWLYRDDYRIAGFPMLPVVEPDGARTGRQALFYAAALVPTSLGPTLIGSASWVYAAVAVVLGAALVWLAYRFAATRSDASARALFIGSITYLPLIWTAMILDR